MAEGCNSADKLGWEKLFQNQKDSLHWAAACELLHNASLIHNDISDASTHRRGQSSINHKFGSDMALCLGDWMVAKAFELASRNHMHGGQLAALLAKAMQDTCSGQSSDVKQSRCAILSEWQTIARGKTAPLLAAPIKGAAISADLETNLDRVDELIERNNLQFIEHNVEEIIENDSIVIKFNIYEGEKVLVERINILGNNITNEEVIRGELLVDEGDPFTNLSLDKSIAKIRSKNIFRNVKSKVADGSSSDMKLIDIEVEEKPTGEISAGAGVGTNGGSVAFQVKENNWLGEGKNVSFDIELNEESVRGTLDYVDPNYNFLGNSLGYSVSSVTNDKPDQGYENTLVSGGVRTGFEQYKDLYAQLGLTASYDDLKTLDSASASLKKQSGNFSELAASYGFSYDKRNRAFMPTDGSIISFEQVAPLYADKSFIANTFSTSFYKSLSEDVVGAAKFYLSAVNGLGDDDVRLSKRKALSSKRLRGFEKGKIGPIDGADHIGGNYSAAINFEANLPKILPESTNTDINLFLDFGNVWGVDYDSSIDESNKIRSSTGIAASWLSPLGPMTFIFSTNISKASTDVTEGFNFNLGTTF